MPRAARGRRHERRRKLLKSAKGYWGRRSKLFRPAKDAVAKALTYAYRDRRRRKRDFRSLWITRISAACRAHGTRYSEFMYGLRLAEIELDRKMLSNLAIDDPGAFAELVQTASAAVAKASPPDAEPQEAAAAT